MWQAFLAAARHRITPLFTRQKMLMKLMTTLHGVRCELQHSEVGEVDVERSGGLAHEVGCRGISALPGPPPL